MDVKTLRLPKKGDHSFRFAREIGYLYGKLGERNWKNRDRERERDYVYTPFLGDESQCFTGEGLIMQ